MVGEGQILFQPAKERGRYNVLIYTVNDDGVDVVTANDISRHNRQNIGETG